MDDFQVVWMVLGITVTLMGVGLLISFLSLRRVDGKIGVSRTEYAGKARSFWLSLSASQQEELGLITGRTDQKTWIQEHGTDFSGLDVDRVYLELCNQGYLKWGASDAPVGSAVVEPVGQKLPSTPKLAGDSRRGRNKGFKERVQQVKSRNQKQNK